MYIKKRPYFNKRGLNGTSELFKFSRVTWRLYKSSGLSRNAPEQRKEDHTIKSIIRNITTRAMLRFCESMKKASFNKQKLYPKSEKTVNSNDLNPKM